MADSSRSVEVACVEYIMNITSHAGDINHFLAMKT